MLLHDDGDDADETKRMGYANGDRQIIKVCAYESLCNTHTRYYHQHDIDVIADGPDKTTHAMHRRYNMRLWQSSSFISILILNIESAKQKGKPVFLLFSSLLLSNQVNQLYQGPKEMDDFCLNFNTIEINCKILIAKCIFQSTLTYLYYPNALFADH